MLSLDVVWHLFVAFHPKTTRGRAVDACWACRIPSLDVSIVCLAAQNVEVDAMIHGRRKLATIKLTGNSPGYRKIVGY